MSEYIKNVKIKNLLESKIKWAVEEFQVEIKSKPRRKAWSADLTDETEIYKIHKMLIYQVNTEESIVHTIVEIHSMKIRVDNSLYELVDKGFKFQKTEEGIIKYLEHI